MNRTCVSVSFSVDIARSIDLDDQVVPKVTPADAARLLDMSRPTVSRRIASGKLPARKVGNPHKIAVEALVAYQQAISDPQAEILRDLVKFEQDVAAGEPHSR